MKAYRISASKYIDDLSGTGSRLYGGRWNRKGTSVLYCSENVSLAVLEILVHFDGLTIPNNLQLLHLEIQNCEVADFPISTFERLRKSENAELDFKMAGEEWVRAGVSLAIRVPSIIIPGESNILVNPAHPDFHKLSVVKKESLDLDERLFR